MLLGLGISVFWVTSSSLATVNVGVGCTRKFTGYTEINRVVWGLYRVSGYAYLKWDTAAPYQKSRKSL